MKRPPIKKHWLLMAFVAWIALGYIIAFTTYTICGSMWPVFYDTPRGSPEYSFLQKFLFGVANFYSWPVTKLFHIIENPIFDVRAKPFALEIADIKFGLTVPILYAFFYTFCMWLVVKLWPAAETK